MFRSSRRQFLSEIGRGMLLAGLGSSLASDLGIATSEGAEDDGALAFGVLEPLVTQMQETPADQLIERLVEQLRAGADLKTLVAAGALANTRTFGGLDYVGFHSFMALAPAYRMARQLPADEQPLPVLKVLHRNTKRIQDFGGRSSELMRAIEAMEIPENVDAGERLREVSRQGDVDAADRTFAALSKLPAGEAFNHLQLAVEDEVDVHRVVLAWRAWDTLELAGPEWAHCMLRQSIRYCANAERSMIERNRRRSPIRTLLPKLLDEYQLIGRPLGNKVGDDGWLQQLALTIFSGAGEDAADAVAQALREGFAPESIGEAISLAANLLVLRDPGRPAEWSSSEKPEGSCHGDSVGVHASDAANAWRNIVRVSNPRNVVASLIVGAFHTGGQSSRALRDPLPSSEHLRQVRSEDPATLLSEAEAAIRTKDQFTAAAAVARYGQLGFEPQPVCDLLLKYATSEDGALHAEKYYNTAVAEFATMRPAFRWGQLVALARVTASQYGYPSDGYQQARTLWKAAKRS